MDQKTSSLLAGISAATSMFYPKTQTLGYLIHPLEAHVVARLNETLNGRYLLLYIANSISISVCDNLSFKKTIPKLFKHCRAEHALRTVRARSTSIVAHRPRVGRASLCETAEQITKAHDWDPLSVASAIPTSF